ncbi:hypothetical protein PGT21_006696 [Puccinia graminis f. sp. tritici]|uniref:Uncharacterized protein n=1 Tax=Puccinia graminis f. sp. tritici TaxID=56615 RepID=A0A5B0MWQ6_PUCGR|nr:hypothetical protein PGTUg99_027071 [Puccinia graminis f. sp. tritici]KAA1103989.1 hypothetical protein PGT21_006696 [Puccinia graminis f. sp. tritici]
MAPPECVAEQRLGRVSDLQGSDGTARDASRAPNATECVIDYRVVPQSSGEAGRLSHSDPLPRHCRLSHEGVTALGQAAAEELPEDENEST